MIAARRPPDRPGRLEAVDDRHLQVQEDDVRIECLAQFECLSAVVSDGHLVAHGLEQLDKGVGDIDFVIDNKDLGDRLLLEPTSSATHRQR